MAADQGPYFVRSLVTSGENSYLHQVCEISNHENLHSLSAFAALFSAFA